MLKKIILALAGLILVGIGLAFATKEKETKDTINTESVDVDTAVDTVETINTDTAAPTVEEAPVLPVPVAEEKPTAVKPSTDSQEGGVAATMYVSGGYSAETTYKVPNGMSHDSTLNITIANDVVTAVDMSFTGGENPASTNWQGSFLKAVEGEIVGKTVDQIKASRIGGASLTTGAFNKALEIVKGKAKA